MVDFRIRVVVDPNQAKRGSRAAEQSLGRVSKAADRVRSSIGRAFAGIAAGAGVVAGVRLLSNFSQALSTVSAVTGATEKQFASLREEAERLGQTTRFTATQAAEGLLFLARAGFDVDEALTSIEDVLLLAQAGALDLGRAADIASNVLQGFRLEAEQTARVTDVLALTANSANTDIEQLGQAMSFLAPAAAAVGVEVEEAAAAVGVLSNAGIQATRAGTAVRQIFIQLITAGEKNADTLGKLGIGLQDLNVESRGLVPVLETLRDANVGLEEAAKLVGDRQASALLVMIDSIDQLKKLTAANEGAEGTTRRVATVMDDNLNGALLRVNSALQSVVLGFGSLGAERGLTEFFNGLASVLRTLADNLDVLVPLIAAGLTFALLALVPVVVSATASIIALVGASTAYTAIGVTMIGTTGVLATSLAFLRGVVLALNLAILANPYVALALAISLVVGAVVALTLSTETLSDAIEEETNFLRDQQVELVTNKIKTSELAKEKINETFTHRNNIKALLEEAIAFNQLAKARDTFGLFEALGIDLGEEDVAALNTQLAEANRQLQVLEATRRDLQFQETRPSGAGGVDPIVPSDVITPEAEKVISDLTFDLEQLGRIARDQNIAGSLRSAGFAVDALGASADKIRAVSGALFDKTLADRLATEAAEDAADTTRKRAADLQTLVDRLDPVASAQRQLAEETQLLNEVEGDSSELVRRLNAELANQIDPLGAIVSKLREEAELLLLSNNERARRQAILGAEETIGRKLTDVEAAQIAELIRQNKALSDQRQVLDDIQEPQQRYEERLRAITALLDANKISQEQANVGLRDNRLELLGTQTTVAAGVETAFLQAQKNLEDFSSTSRDLVKDAFSDAQETVVNFFETGTFSAEKFFKSLASNLIQLGTQQAFAAVFSQSSPLFGSKGSGEGGIIEQAGGFLSGLLGFQRGGSFTIGAGTSVASLPGADNRLVSFKGQDGEKVNVTPRDQEPDGGTTIINFNTTAQEGPTDVSSQNQQATRVVAGLDRRRRNR